MLESGAFPRITLETDSLELAIALVRAEVGLTVAPRWAVAAMPQGVTALSVGPSGLWRTWALTYPAALRLTSIHRAFLRICGDLLNAGLSLAPAKESAETSMNWERTGTA